MVIEKTFSQADYATKLRVPEGKPFVIASNVEEMQEALKQDKAVYVHSCNGRAFLWKERGKYMVDRFFMGPSEGMEYDSEAEAIDHVATMCE